MAYQCGLRNTGHANANVCNAVLVVVVVEKDKRITDRIGYVVHNKRETKTKLKLKKRGG